MDNTLLVSIVIPVYNVELYIEDCLNSVISQNYSNIECIIVDDMSPDNSMDKVECFLEKYRGTIPFRIFRHSSNSGLSAARNTGVENSWGDYVFFLDSDDELLPNAIALMISKINLYGTVDFIVGGIKVEGKLVEFLVKSPEYLNSNLEVMEEYLRGGFYVMACGKLIKKKFLLENEIFFRPQLLHEDLLYSFLLSNYSVSVICLKDYVYKYKIRENSISSCLREQNFVDLLISIAERIEYINKNILLSPSYKCQYIVDCCFDLQFRLLANLKNICNATVIDKQNRSLLTIVQWKHLLCGHSRKKYIYLKLPFCIQKIIYSVYLSRNVFH